MESRHSRAVPIEILQAEGFDPAESCGLFIGVSLFEDKGLAPVPFAVDDATDLAHLFIVELGLISPANAILSLAGEPEKPETRDRLGRLLETGVRRVSARRPDLFRYLGEQAREAGPRGLLLITAATHGVSDTEGDYLVATDTVAEYPKQTAFAVDDLFDKISHAASPRRLVLLDACRERLTKGSRSIVREEMARTFAEALSRAAGQVVLSGASEGGFAYDDEDRKYGVFTAAVLDGLRGDALVDERGLITVRTLADFVQQRVLSWVRRNRPEDAALSLGIGQRFEGPAGSLPLAIDPKRTETAEIYRGRRVAALARLAANLGPVIKGSDYALVERLLPESEASPTAEQLLDEIELLDGTPLALRRFGFFLYRLKEQALIAESAKTRIPGGKSGGANPSSKVLLFLGLLYLLGTVWLAQNAMRIWHPVDLFLFGPEVEDRFIAPPSKDDLRMARRPIGKGREVPHAAQIEAGSSPLTPVEMAVPSKDATAAEERPAYIICEENDPCAGTVISCKHAGDDIDEVTHLNKVVTGKWEVTFGEWSNSQCGTAGKGWHQAAGTCGKGAGDGFKRCTSVRVIPN